MIGRKFLTAGEAILTASSEKTLSHYTFKVCRPDDFKPESPVWFVSMLTGPNNTEDYTYLGLLNAQGHVIVTKKSAWQETEQCFKVARWVIRQIWDEKPLPEGYKVNHMGRCSACGRPLTHPESLKTGLGPICAGRE